jgi:hypothetical protein
MNTIVSKPGRLAGDSLVPLLMVVLAGLVSSGEIQAQTPKWKFMVFGDTRGKSISSQINTTVLTELARAATNEKPAFVLVPGDLVYSGDLPSFQSWSNIMAPVYQAGIRVYPCRGNHDDDTDATAFTNFFKSTLPTNGPASELWRTYSITCSNALVLVLDQYVTAHRVNQTWINAVLATNTRPHIFAMGHEPAFKENHADCLDDYPANRDTFWNSLSNANCRIYFAGHDHFYDHMRLNDGDGNTTNDLHQMIVGSGGAPVSTDTYPYDGVNSLWTPTRAFHEQQTNGYVIVELDGYKVTTTWHSRTSPNTYSDTTDIFSYSITPVTPVLTWTFSSNHLALIWTGGGPLLSASYPGGPFSPVPGATSPYVITNLDGPPQYFRAIAP